MPIENLPQNEPLPVYKAFKHLLVFQLKLLVDAVRDIAFSPISLFAFIYDAIVKPAVSESMSHKMMLLGRRSDRVINLFNEYTGSGEYTIDETVAEVENVLHREIEERIDRVK